MVGIDLTHLKVESHGHVVDAEFRDQQWMTRKAVWQFTWGIFCPTTTLTSIWYSTTIRVQYTPSYTLNSKRLPEQRKRTYFGTHGTLSGHSRCSKSVAQSLREPKTKALTPNIARPMIPASGPSIVTRYTVQYLVVLRVYLDGAPRPEAGKNSRGRNTKYLPDENDQ